MKCQTCRTEFQTNARFCSNCGATRNMGQGGRIIVGCGTLLALMLVVGVIVVAVKYPQKRAVKVTGIQKAGAVKEGSETDKVVLWSSGTPGVVGCFSEEASEDLIRFVADQNTAGFSQMIMSGRCAVFENGTPVHLVRGIFRKEVLIEGGPYTGRHAFVNIESVKIR